MRKWFQIVWTMKKHREGENLAAGASVNIHYSEKKHLEVEKSKGKQKWDERENVDYFTNTEPAVRTAGATVKTWLDVAAKWACGA